MEKVFKFLSSLTALCYEILGNPTIKFHDDEIDIYFEFTATIRDLEIFRLRGFDEFRMYPSNCNNSIIVVFTFYK